MACMLPSQLCAGKALPIAPPAARPAVACQAEAPQAPQISRRQALGLAAGAAALLTSSSPAQAAFGEGARVFSSKATNSSGFIPYSGEGYALLLPSKWNPSREREAPGVQLKYSDNGDNLTSVYVTKNPTTKSSIDQVGSPEAFLTEIEGVLGQQVYKGETRSEGGFRPNRVSAASLLSADAVRDKKGVQYYKYHVLTRSADGNEGGKHHFINAAVSNGNLFICHAVVGDKRFAQGANKDAEGVMNSFVVA